MENNKFFSDCSIREALLVFCFFYRKLMNTKIWTDRLIY